MAIKFTNARQLSTAVPVSLWDNQARASLSFFIKYDPSGSVSNSVLNTNYLFERGLGSFFASTVGNGTSSSLNFSIRQENTSHQVATKVVTLYVGSIYHIALVYDQGSQLVYVNGTPNSAGTLNGNTLSGTWGVQLGVASVPGTPLVYWFDDWSFWDGYALSASEVADLRDRVKLPPDIAPPGVTRCRWTLAGTTGANVTIGDPGLANYYGDTSLDIKTATGTGSAVYGAPLIFVPAAVATPYVATSGKIVGVAFTASSDGSTVTPSALTSTPTIKINGVSRGALGTAYLLATNSRVLFPFPAGVEANPGDVVTITAPRGWATTSVGIVSSLDDQAISNYAGRSSVGTDDLARTFKPGWNNAHLHSIEWSTWNLLKNWRYRMNRFTNTATSQADGKPLTLTASPATAPWYTVGPSNGLDFTAVPPVPGLWAIGWDDLDTAHPTTFDLVTWNANMVVVTERVDLRNPGSGGLGKVRVFDIQPVSSVAAPATSSASAVRVQLTCPSKAPVFDNLVIYAPGDFTPGTPTALDVSAPYAINSIYLSRVANGCGSMRWVDSCWDYAGFSNAFEHEHAWKLDDFQWNLSPAKVSWTFPITTARPWSHAVTPYIYSSVLGPVSGGNGGESYAATLGADIDASQTVITVSDAATAPVIEHQRLLIGSELMRVTNVSGTSVTVTRGELGTTAASHGAGSIQVQYRFPLPDPLPYGQWAEVVCSVPHRIGITDLKVAGTWPAFTFTDGSVSFPTSAGVGRGINLFNTTVFPTGATTFLVFCTQTMKPGVTLSQTYTLVAGCQATMNFPSAPGIPVAMAAKAVAAIPDCNIHVNVPHASTDSLVDWIATEVRDNLPAGREVYLEYTNEPWNSFFQEYHHVRVLRSFIYPAEVNDSAWYVRRGGEIKQRFVDRFNEGGRNRGGEIKWVINTQKLGTPTILQDLDIAKRAGIHIDGIATSTYAWPDDSAASSTAAWAWDDEQVIDLYIHDLYYNSKANYAVAAAMKAAIDGWNTSNNDNVFLYAYEGGISRMHPSANTTLVGSIDATQGTITVASTSGMIPGVPLLIGVATNVTSWLSTAEHMIVQSIAGNVLTVLRGQGSTTAQSHASGVNVRTCYMERHRDLMHNPNAYIAQLDTYGFYQRVGFEAVNEYALSITNYDTGYNGAYQGMQIVPGRGDGSDGKADNRLVLATPGKPNTKSAIVNQDLATVSVRGRAFLDWMAATGEPPITPTPWAPVRYRPRFTRPRP